jgi:hypothetical protein
MLGRRSVSFDIKPFKKLRQGPKDFGFDHYMALVIYPVKQRIVIDYGDKVQCNADALDWADSYFKVNIREGATDSGLSPEMRRKIKQLPPSFGIRITNSIALFAMFIRNLTKIGCSSGWPVSTRAFFGGYNWARKRNPLGAYEPGRSRDNYIFHASQLYRNQSGGNQANESRARFIRACQRLPINFEGGLIGNDRDTSWGDVTQDLGYSSEVYLEKTRQSVVAFNTPAAWGCHGWKLGEYFALGKAIVSDQFVNDLPEGMEHGVNIHFLQNINPLEVELASIIKDKQYLSYLELNSRQYFQKYLHPKAVAQRILDN